ncbi:nuclear transport factor 2 family protein [Haloarcula nitratireducens]|uniref:Nuclear transport factor 2 family protein n=1 Tax=Haloarcula nitratireducens TaxID=2487749 RepID=A0AAW4PIH4_9EURY|nr:nuclear transport factor 2 family protein [Halomicroarcula nitratireducens]MBX0297448.1 nuclear transport factor 2 family protein [Halomicroarcula nitratireducens]
MTASEDRLTPAQIDAVLRAFEDGETATAAEFWAEEGAFIDPQYPDSQYSGPDEIRNALDWALDHIVEEPGLSVRKIWADDETFAVEVDTRHRLHDGTTVDFPQVFIIEGDNGQIARWQSYLPFPPPSSE